MKRIETSKLDRLYKQELKKFLNTQELIQFPPSLKVQAVNTQIFDRWRVQKDEAIH
jgi:hypothetical protein